MILFITSIAVSFCMLILTINMGIQAHLARRIAARLLVDDVYYHEVRGELLRKNQEALESSDITDLIEETVAFQALNRQHGLETVWKSALNVFLWMRETNSLRNDFVEDESMRADWATTIFSETGYGPYGARYGLKA